MEYLGGMYTKAVLLLLCCVALAFALPACGDCSKKLDCPGFADDTLTRLFPYANNQRLVFRSDTGSVLTLNLTNTRTTEPYQARGGFTSPVRCAEEKVFESTERDTALHGPLFAVHLQSGDYQSVDVRIHRNAFYFNNFTDTSFRTVSLGGFPAMPVYRSTVTVGNRTFADVTVAQRDTSGEKRSGVYRLFYNRAEGIVGYTDFPSNINWVKQ